MSETGGKLRDLYDAHGEKLRYLIVGVWNTALGYGVFWLAITFLATPLREATRLDFKVVALVLQWAVWVVMVVNSVAMMKYFAFRTKGHLGKQILRGYVVYLPAQGISTLILFGFMQALGGGPTAAKLGQAAAVAIATVFSYIGHKYFTFRVPLETGEVPDRELIEG